MLRRTLAAYRDKEDLITIGAYTPGADQLVDYAIAKLPMIDGFLRQLAGESTPAEAADEALIELMADAPALAGPGVPALPPAEVVD
jgi:flagellum-specific ATP synthase